MIIPMNKVIIQVPVSKQLRDSAERAAEEYGFSSLQEVLRVFLAKFANRSVSINFEDIVPLQIKKKP